MKADRRRAPKLFVVEAADAVFVCDGDCDCDCDCHCDGVGEWVVRFERRPGFDAEGWARRMAARASVSRCNGRRSRS